MNKITASITEIKNIENLHLVTLDFEGERLSMLTLELPFGIQKGSRVVLNTKPSNVMLAKGFSGAVSTTNQLSAEVIMINMGELVSMVQTKIHHSTMQSLLTTASLEKMQLQTGDSVTILIQSSALSILEVLS